MLNDIRKSINSTLYERVSSPLYGAAIVSWLIWNWEIAYLTIFVSESKIEGNKINYILENYSNIHNLLTYPIISTVILLTIMPFFSNGAYYLNLIFKKWRIDKRNEVEKKQLLSIEKSIELRTEIRNQEDVFEKLLEGKNEEIRILNQELEEYRSRPQNGENHSESTDQETTPRSKSIEPDEDTIPEIDSTQRTNNYPTIRDVVMKHLPSSEAEWLIVYSFYASDFGTNSFTNKNLLDMYDLSNRSTDSRRRNISNNLKTLFKKNYLSALNTKDHIVTEIGKQQAIQIITGQSKPATKPKSSPKPSSKASSKSGIEKKKSWIGTGQSFKLDRNLNLRPSGKESLKDFASQYKLTSSTTRILIIVYYLKETLGMNGINSDHIYTGFEELNFRVPKSLYQLISDTKNKKGWLDFENMEDIGLSIQGRNYIKYDLEKK